SLGDFPTFPSTIAAPQPKSPEPVTPATTVTAPVPPTARPAGTESTDVRELLPIGSGYKLLNRIGRGGFGKVYRAEAPGGLESALKIINGSIVHEDGAKRELQALELMRGLHHAYLLPVHAYWPLDDQLIIAMELADGCLKDAVQKMPRSKEGGARAEDLMRY